MRSERNRRQLLGKSFDIRQLVTLLLTLRALDERREAIYLADPDAVSPITDDPTEIMLVVRHGHAAAFAPGKLRPSSSSSTAQRLPSCWLTRRHQQPGWGSAPRGRHLPLIRGASDYSKGATALSVTYYPADADAQKDIDTWAGADLVGDADRFSHFAAPLHVAPKKESNGLYTNKRTATDFREFNAHFRFRHSILRPTACPTSSEDILAAATGNGQNILTTADLLAGFLQIPIHPPR